MIDIGKTTANIRAIIEHTIRVISWTRDMISSISSISYEVWKTFFETGAVALLLLSFIFGYGAYWANKRINAEEKERSAIAGQSLLELQEKIKPRHLTEEQTARMIKFLKSQPKGEIMLSWFADDKESIDFAKQIGDILQSVEWKVVKGNEYAFFGSPQIGIILTVQELSAIPPHAGAVSTILADLGFPVSMQESRSFGKNDIDLFVAKKP